LCAPFCAAVLSVCRISSSVSLILILIAREAIAEVGFEKRCAGHFLHKPVNQGQANTERLRFFVPPEIEKKTWQS